MKVIGAAIQEVMESYEVEIAGKVHPVKAIRTITGHDILRYHIHGGKQIPFIKNNSRQKMEEGEVFAIETFGTTGTAYLDDNVRTLVPVLFLVSICGVSDRFCRWEYMATAGKKMYQVPTYILHPQNVYLRLLTPTLEPLSFPEDILSVLGFKIIILAYVKH
jgi:hypothetical protein